MYPHIGKITSDVVFCHYVRQIRIPTRIISDEEYRKALAVVNTIKAAEPEDQLSTHSPNRFLKEIKDNEK